MAATKGQMNWEAVSWNSVTITRVDNVAISMGGNLLDYAGDTDIYPTIQALSAVKPTVSITTSDPATLLGLVPGLSFPLNATWKDVKGAAGGDVVFVIAGATFEGADATGAHGALGTAVASFKCVTADGITNPIGITRS